MEANTSGSAPSGTAGADGLAVVAGAVGVVVCASTWVAAGATPPSGGDVLVVLAVELLTVHGF